jgi:hypothetical protein
VPDGPALRLAQCAAITQALASEPGLTVFWLGMHYSVSDRVGEARGRIPLRSLKLLDDEPQTPGVTGLPD